MAGEALTFQSQMPSPLSSPQAAPTMPIGEELNRGVREFVFDLCLNKLKKGEASITSTYNEFVAGQDRALKEQQRLCQKLFTEVQNDVFHAVRESTRISEEEAVSIMEELSAKFSNPLWSVKGTPLMNPADFSSQIPSTPPPEVDHNGIPSATVSVAEAVPVLEPIEGPSTPPTELNQHRAQSATLSVGEATPLLTSVEQPSTPHPETRCSDGPSASLFMGEDESTAQADVEESPMPSSSKRAQSPDLSSIETPSKRLRTTQTSGNNLEPAGTSTRYRIKPADRRKTSHRTLMMNEVDGLEYIISPSISPGQWFIFRCGCKNHPFVRDPLESGFGLRRHLKSKPHQNFHDHLDYEMSDEDLILKYGYEVQDADEESAKRSNEMLKERRAKKATEMAKRPSPKTPTPRRRRAGPRPGASVPEAQTTVPVADMSVNGEMPATPPLASWPVISDVQGDSDTESLPPLSSVGRK
ncbi:uncharacterized protein E0L32_004427 [Thyridium curvatum]|uniref:Uncharacterized protein n=1 Tax=Thyridium curvatum TaxID=1093900 RepID=A0A507B6N2_9PEZI|nr:uncharacterized protein E0L32_004427 [Thyridium curvatum]TPX15447.1 hypothetical protein E0L32_004427 [Thyridium curvatum]